MTTTETRTETQWALDKVHSSINFWGRQMGVSTVRGRFNDFDVSLSVRDDRPESARIEARIRSASVDTGFPPRDQHLAGPDFLDAEHYPEIVFRSTSVESGTDDRLRMEGELTIKETTRPVSVDVRLDGITQGTAGGRRVAFIGTTVIDRRDWGLTWNMPAGSDAVLVGYEIHLEFDLTFEEQPGQG